MLVDFNSLPGHARVWVYQSSRCMTPEEQSRFAEMAASFVSEWTAHQEDLKASVMVADGYFIVFAVDESFNEASGCSIDKKVAFMKKAEQSLAVSFFDRMNVVWTSGDNELRLSKLHDLPRLMESGEVNESTIVYNNLIATMDEFRNRWKCPLGQTWMMQFAGKVTN